MSEYEGEIQKRLTMRLTDPFGYLVFEIQCLVPASMVTNIMTDWTNTLNLKAVHNAMVEYHLDVVLK